MKTSVQKTPYFTKKQAKAYAALVEQTYFDAARNAVEFTDEVPF